jgi:hypothetical protein
MDFIARQGENLDRNIEIAVWLVRAAYPAAEEIRLANERLCTGPFRDSISHILDTHDPFSYIRPGVVQLARLPLDSFILIVRPGAA